MSRPAERLMVPAAVAAMVILAGLASPRAGLAQPAAQKPAAAAAGANPDAPKAVFERACRACHDLGVVTGQRKTRAGWEDTVAQMMSRGLAINDDQADEIVDYLAKTYSAD